MPGSHNDGAARTRRLLLVEDDRDDVELTRLMIDDTGDPWEVEVVDRLASAVERLRQGGIDVVLMDLGLPDGRGPAAVRTVVSEAPGVPVIVLTGADHDASVAREALRAGARACLVKGKIDAAGLRRSLNEALSY